MTIDFISDFEIGDIIVAEDVQFFSGFWYISAFEDSSQTTVFLITGFGDEDRDDEWCRMLMTDKGIFYIEDSDVGKYLCLKRKH